MKKAFPLAGLLVAVVACAALGAIVLQQRAAIARLHQQLAATEQERVAQVETTHQEVARLKEHNEALKAESETLRRNRGLAGVAGASPGSKPAAPATSADPAGATQSESGAGEGGNFMKGLAKMFTDPEMKKVMRQQQAMGIRMMYGDLGKELGLSGDALDQLYEMLADRQMEVSVKGMEMLNGSGDGGQLEAAGKEANATREAHDAKLKAALGEEGFARFQEYERTVGDRFMMQQYQSQFAASGAPLEDEQKESLLRIIYDERSRTQATMFDPTNKDVAGQMRALQSDEALHQYLASQEDFNRRVLQRAGEVLGPEQVAAFEKIQKQMLEMQQAGVKMSRAMFQKQ
jgi:hypothetical protein